MDGANKYVPNLGHIPQKRTVVVSPKEDTVLVTIGHTTTYCGVGIWKGLSVAMTPLDGVWHAL